MQACVVCVWIEVLSFFFTFFSFFSFFCFITISLSGEKKKKKNFFKKKLHKIATTSLTVTPRRIKLGFFKGLICLRFCSLVGWSACLFWCFRVPPRFISLHFLYYLPTCLLYSLTAHHTRTILMQTMHVCWSSITTSPHRRPKNKILLATQYPSSAQVIHAKWYTKKGGGGKVKATSIISRSRKETHPSRFRARRTPLVAFSR